MKKKILIGLAFLCAISVSAQNVEKSIKKAIEANQVIIDDLQDNIDELTGLYNKLDSTLRVLSERKFPRSISETELRDELEKLTLKEVWKNENKIHGKLDLAKDTELACYYVQIIKIYESLNAPYDKRTNDDYIKHLGELKMLECHVDEFKKLSASVNDYRFVMFELARVFKVIDNLKGVSTPDEVRKKLNESDELEFITEDFPYVQKCLGRYIEFKVLAHRQKDDSNELGNRPRVEDSERTKLLEELKKACPDAFADF